MTGLEALIPIAVILASAWVLVTVIATVTYVVMLKKMFK